MENPHIPLDTRQEISRVVPDNMDIVGEVLVGDLLQSPDVGENAPDAHKNNGKDRKAGKGDNQFVAYRQPGKQLIEVHSSDPVQ